MSTNLSLPGFAEENVITPDVDEPWLPTVSSPGTAAALAGAAVAAALLGGWAAPSFGVFTAASAALLASALAVLAFIDFKVHRLPDAIVLPLYGVFGLLNLLAAVTGEIGWDRFWTAAACSAGALVVYWVLAVLTGLGFGDVKLAGVLGMTLGVYGIWQVALGTLLLPVSIGGVAAFGLLLLGRSGKDEMAFGPYIAAGALLVLTVPQVTALVSGQPV